jgi:hypothetical protein
MIVRRLVADRSRRPKINPPETILKLRGLGKELWRGIDPKTYINELRDEWER